MSFAELQEHNQSQSSNNSPQIKSSKKRGLNSKSSSKGHDQKFALSPHNDYIEKSRKIFCNMLEIKQTMNKIIQSIGIDTRNVSCGFQRKNVVQNLYKIQH